MNYTFDPIVPKRGGVYLNTTLPILLLFAKIIRVSRIVRFSIENLSTIRRNEMRSLCIYRWLCIAIISIPFLVFAWTPTALALYFMSWINDLCLLEEMFLCPMSASMETSLPPSLKFEVNKRKIKPRSFARYYEETASPSSFEEEYKKIDTIGVILDKVREAAMNESGNGTFVDAAVAATTTTTTSSTTTPTNTNITTTTTTITTTTSTAKVIDIDVVDYTYSYPVATNTTTTTTDASASADAAAIITTSTETIDGGGSDAGKKSNDRLTMIATTRTTTTTTKSTKKSDLPISLNDNERLRNSSPKTFNNEEERPASIKLNDTVLRRIGSRVLNSKQTVFFNDKCCSVDPIARIPISMKKLTLGVLTIAGISISLIILSQTTRVGRWNPSVITYEYPTERARRSFYGRSRNQLNAAVWYYKNTASKDFATIKYSKTYSRSLTNVVGSIDVRRKEDSVGKRDDIYRDQNHHHNPCIFRNEYQTKVATDTIHRSSSSPLEQQSTVATKPITTTAAAYPLPAVSFIEKKSPLLVESSTVKTTQGASSYSSSLLIRSSEETSSKNSSSRTNYNRKYVILAWSTHICYASSKRPVRSSPLFYRKQRVGIESPTTTTNTTTTTTTLPSSTISSPMLEIKSFIEKEIVRSTIVVFTTVTKLTTFFVIGCCLIAATIYGTPILRSCDIYHNSTASSVQRNATTTTTKIHPLCEYTSERSIQSYMMSNPYKLYCCVPESRNTETLNWFVDSLIYSCVVGFLYYVCRRYVLMGARFKDFSIVNERSNYFERLFRSKNARAP